MRGFAGPGQVSRRLHSCLLGMANLAHKCWMTQRLVVNPAVYKSWRTVQLVQGVGWPRSQARSLCDDCLGACPMQAWGLIGGFAWGARHQRRCHRANKATFLLLLSFLQNAEPCPLNPTRPRVSAITVQATPKMGGGKQSGWRCPPAAPSGLIPRQPEGHAVGRLLSKPGCAPC